MKEFLELVGKDPELKEKVRELDKNGTMADMIALAAQHGVTLTEADFAKCEGELSEDELSAVAGGSGNDCLISYDSSDSGPFGGPYGWW